MIQPSIKRKTPQQEEEKVEKLKMGLQEKFVQMTI